MRTGTNDFSAAHIRRLLDLLTVELRSRGTAAYMYVVGGAAIALRIEIATPEALLAMKLVASRNRDLRDIW